VLGSPTEFEYKFEKLQAFYEKAIPQVGWDYYSRINLDYSDQVIATKRKKK
jgi:cell division protein FtsQ